MVKERAPNNIIGLIETKFSPLVPPVSSIERERLVERVFAQPDAAQVIEIIGVAGSGKSLLMGQLFREATAGAMQCCWLTLEAEDDAPLIFATYLAEALGRLDKKLAKDMQGILRGPRGGHPELLFKSFCEGISRLQHPAFIFLDDFQHISDPSIIEGMQRLIMVLPTNVRIAIASRTILRLKMNKLAIEGRLLRLDQKALAFDGTETAAFLNGAHQLQLGRLATEKLSVSTEGWAAGLQLAAIALAKQPERASALVEEFSGAHSELSNYLMESVFQSLEADLQSFLVQTGPLKRMNAELCYHVTKQKGVQEIVQRIQRRNLFFVPLDESGEWFRLHHLFADFLIAQLKKSGARAFETCCERASEWFEQKGLLTEAIQYKLRAGQYAEAAELIAQSSSQVAQFLGDHNTVLDWLRRLPERYHWHHPFILLNKAWSQTFARSANDGYKTAMQVRDCLLGNSDHRWELSEEDYTESLCLADVIIAISLASGDQIEEARAFAFEALDRWPEAADAHLGALYNVIGYSSIPSFQSDHGLDAAAKARLHGGRAKSEYVKVWADWISGILCLEQGRLGDAKSHRSRAQDDISGDIGKESFAGSLVSVLDAAISYEEGDISATLNILEAASSFLPAIASMEPIRVFKTICARSLYAQGDAPAALATLRAAQEDALTNAVPRLAVALAVQEVRIMIEGGMVADAWKLGRRWGFVGNDNIFGINVEEPLISRQAKLGKAHLLVAKDQFSAAQAVLMDLSVAAQAAPKGRIAVEVNLLRTIALWRSGRQADALRAFSEVTAIAARSKLYAPFFEVGTQISDLLETVITRRGSKSSEYLAEQIDFERQIAAYLKGDSNWQDSGTMDQAELVVPGDFTSREIEILNLLAEGLSNAELADSLLVSLPTIKWHLGNVFSKLAVKNRSSAIKKARQNRLIEF